MIAIGCRDCTDSLFGRLLPSESTHPQGGAPRGTHLNVFGGSSLELVEKKAIHPCEKHGVFWQNLIKTELLSYWFGITRELEKDALRTT
jgi:hypothetical protein